MKKKLLVADDSLTIQKVIRLALKEDGYDIHAVSDGPEAMQQLSLIQPDVVLIDIDLPGGSAFDVKKAANEDPRCSDIAFILMSSAFEKVDEAKTALLGFQGRLTKPFDPSNLRSTLTSVLQNSVPQIRRATPPPPPVPTQNFEMDLSDDRTSSIQLDDPLWNDTQSESTEQNDIRQLTESTVKMSGGFDDLGGWNIQENSKSGIPPLPQVFPDEPAPEIETFNNSDFSQNSFSSSSFSPSAFDTPSIEQIAEKVIREQLPDIVEKVIRQELRRLLENMN